MIKIKLWKLALLLIFSINIFIFQNASANNINVAVASNFVNPFREIATQFEKETNNSVKIISGSTGKLYAQIINGAPFEFFLAADQKCPLMLEKNGYAIVGTRFTYALGKISLWSMDSKAIPKNGEAMLRGKNFNHIAIANPKTAPYGKAALQTMQKLGVWTGIQDLIVQGENINQTFQFIASQNAELGFVALSQILDPKNQLKGKRWDVPINFYDPIKQDSVILKLGNKNTAVKILSKFLKSKKVTNIIQKYGYELP